RNRCWYGRDQRPAQLAAGSDDQGLLRFHWPDVNKSRMRLVCRGQLRPLEWDWPVDRQRLVRKVDEGVGIPCCRTPVIIDQVGVRGVLRQGLEGVPDPARHKDRSLGAHLGGEAAAEAFSWSQIDPGAEDPPRGQ